MTTSDQETIRYDIMKHILCGPYPYGIATIKQIADGEDLPLDVVRTEVRELEGLGYLEFWVDEHEEARVPGIAGYGVTQLGLASGA